MSIAITPCANETRFDEFWELFPKQRKGSRKKAEQAYNTALKEKRANEKEIINGLTAYRDSDEVANGFAKGAAAWLNDDRWANDYTIKPSQSAGVGNSRASYTDQLADASRIAQANYQNGMQGHEGQHFGDLGGRDSTEQIRNSEEISEWSDMRSGDVYEAKLERERAAIGGLSLPSCPEGNHSQTSVEASDAQDFGGGCITERISVE